jgi:transcription-repair coupling factor (superfamily II helicase)
VEPVITVEVEALLPETYVPEVNQRLALYQRVAELDDVAEIAQVQAELADRFGPPPAAVLALLDVVGLRVAARGVGVEKIDARGGRAAFTFAPSTPVTPEHILKVIAQSRGKMALRKEYTLDVRIPAEPWPAVRDALSAVLGSLK